MISYRHLYIHVPFCVAKCGYCAFYSIVGNHDDLRQQFLEKLSKDLQKNSEKLQQLETIFIGGGTPSLLTEHELHQMLNHIRKFTYFKDQSYEFSMENNPESINPDKVAIMAEHGVNRLSLGIQSFNPTLRKNLQRIGSLKKLDQAVGAIQDNKISNLNFDFIYAIPGQTIKDLEHDLNEAIQYPISHLSAYSLTIEERTTLAVEGTTVDDDIAVDMWHLIGDILKERAGIDRYEISNYAKPDHHCRHNQGIWMGDRYLGLGPAAASFDGKNRWQEITSFSDWHIGKQPEIDSLDPEDRAREILTMGLRTVNGWSSDRFQQATGQDYMNLCGDVLRHMADTNLLQITDDRLFPTTEGLLFADYIGSQLI